MRNDAHAGAGDDSVRWAVDDPVATFHTTRELDHAAEVACDLYRLEQHAILALQGGDADTVGLCGSGLQAIVSAAQAIALGDCDIAIGGGSESMSRGPYFDTSARYGARMGDAVLVDYMLGILHDPWEKMHLGITAENVAARYKISRIQQDELAVLSQQRAGAAIAAGRFKEQIVAVEVKTRKGIVVFDTDEHVRA